MGEKPTKEQMDQIKTEQQALTDAANSALKDPKYADYVKFREAGKNMKPYEGAPATGKKLGFANIMGGIPFCIAVEKSITEQWALAGGDPANLFIIDNQYDATVGLKNTDIMLSKKPDVFIQFQADTKVNQLTADKFGEAKIPVIAIDVAVPGAPFMGVNNYQASFAAGQAAIAVIEKDWKPSALEVLKSGKARLILNFPFAGGENDMLRTLGMYAAFIEKYGFDVMDPITLINDIGMGEAEQAQKSVNDLLASVPDAEYFITTSNNCESMQGIIAAAQTLGRFDKTKWAIITEAVDDLGLTQIRDGSVDGGEGYFPEHYGEYCVPAAAAFMAGSAAPDWMFIENKLINLENIDSIYPAK
jgi:ribose transport system substrate-binding protein